VSLQILDGADGSNIGGSTLHSWSGIGLGKLPVAKLTEMIRKNNIAVERWRTTGALIIDESEFLSLLVES
jgi:ATP-dependent DNA helicase PIF1